MTKKLFLWLLIAMGLMVCQDTLAWSLWVANTQITKSGQSFTSVSGATMSNGTITFSGSETSGTLTFDNVTLSCDREDIALVLNREIQSLTIRFKGTCKLTSKGNVIHSYFNTTISGGQGICAKATIENNNTVASSSYVPIYIRDGKKLVIRDIHLTVKGNKYAISGDYSGDYANKASYELWTADVNASVSTTLSGYGAISHFATSYITSDDTKYTTGSFKSAKYGVCDSNNTLLKTVTTRNSFTLGNVIVPGANMTDLDYTLSPDGLTSGTIKYDNKNKRLLLNGVTWKATTSMSFMYWGRESQKLTVKVQGTNNISGQSNMILADGELFIDGYTSSYTDNVLNVTATASYNAFKVSDVTFQDINLTAKSPTKPIYGGGSNKLVIKHSKILASPTGSSGDLYGISGFSSCTMTDARCWNSNGCFRSAKKAFAYANGNIIKEVDIRVPTTYYDVYVLGQQLTNVDKSYPGIEGLTGSVVYDSDNKMIKLNSVEITPPSGNTSTGLKFSGSAASVVDLTGTNKIKATNNNAIWSTSGDVTFQGTGSLTAEVTSGNVSCYYVGGSSSVITFNVESPVYLIGGSYGIYSYSESSKLKLKKAGGNTDYFFKGLNDGPIKNFADLELSGVDFYSVGTYYDKTNRVLKRNDGQNFPANTYVDIDAYSTQYSIWVVGRKLNDVNARGLGSANITGPNTAVTYDSTNKILTLNGGTLYCNTDHVIDVREPGVTIKVIGSNKTDIRQTKSSYSGSDYQYGINTTENLTITGTAQLDFNNNGDYNGINISSGKVLTIKDCYYVWTYFINGNSTGSLVVDNSHVYTNGYMHNLANLSLLNNVGIINPQLAKFDSSKKCVVNKDGVKCNSVRINKLESYGLYVCGTAVTNANNKDVLGNGVFVYDPSNKKLTVSGNASCSNNNIIYNPSVSGLEIYFSKTCTLTDTDTGSSAIYLGASTTFTSASNARVNITGSKYNGIYAYGSNTTITFDKVPNMNITANGYGICSYSTSNVLNIKSSYMSVDATSSVISGWKSINLTGCKITSPSGAKVVGGKVTNSSGSVLTNKKVIIEGVATGIDDVEAAPETELATPKAVYDTEGRQIQDMKRGVNIVRMPDGTIRKVMKK